VGWEWVKHTCKRNGLFNYGEQDPCKFQGLGGALNTCYSCVSFWLDRSSVREKKDLPLDAVDQKGEDGSFDYQ
jgi:hypothetical protein